MSSEMTQKSLSLSILMPVYNERYLAADIIKQVLAIHSPVISQMELIIVDDASTDGTWEVLKPLAEKDPRVKLFRHEKNQGKGAALKNALSKATGDVTIVQDADLEYDPRDIPKLMEVFLKEGADAVFGSRYLSFAYRRALMYRHTYINKIITAFVNFLTDVDLTDVETCYKAIKTDLFKSIPIRSNDFAFEVEITMKLARRKANIYEVPISYSPRTYEEGKKIRMRDGFKAIWAGIKFYFYQDIFHQNRDGLHILLDMNNVPRFNQWMCQQLRPFIGDRVLELGAGIGNLTKHFIPRHLYIASDVDDQALHYLRSYAVGKAYLKAVKIDAENPQDFERLHGEEIDTVLMVNMLEHVKQEKLTLQNAHSVLAPGGKAIVLVPQFPSLYGTFDQSLEHRERYTRQGLRQSLEQAGFEVTTLFDFNRTTVPSWYLNGKILKRKRFSRIQLKILETIMPIVSRIDRIWPWGGLSLIAVGVKK